jgi:hypothetical protein
VSNVGATTLASAVPTEVPDGVWSDARLYPRVPYATPVVISIGDEWLEARSEDISERGMQVIASQHVAKGLRVAVRFALPMRGRMVVQHAIIRWVLEPRADQTRAVGLELVEVSSEVQASLARFIALMRTETGAASPD